jgi:tripartite-type tricarboxylate transporter receptor subunit TctC
MTPTGKKQLVETVMRRLPTHLVALTMALVAVAMTCALAETFPDKPIKFVVGFGAGGPTDIVARVLADQLTESLGKKVIVENKTGASGNIATQSVASADGDGYTYLIGASPLAVNHSLFPDFPVKFGRDLVALAPIGATTNVLVVNPSSSPTPPWDRARRRTLPVSRSTCAPAPRWFR